MKNVICSGFFPQRTPASPQRNPPRSVEIEISGPLRLHHESDGWYVIGNGMMSAVNSFGDGEKLIAELTADRSQTDRKKNSGAGPT